MECTTGVLGVGRLDEDVNNALEVGGGNRCREQLMGSRCIRVDLETSKL